MFALSLHDALQRDRGGDSHHGPPPRGVRPGWVVQASPNARIQWRGLRGEACGGWRAGRRVPRCGSKRERFGGQRMSQMLCCVGGVSGDRYLPSPSGLSRSGFAPHTSVGAGEDIYLALQVTEGLRPSPSPWEPWPTPAWGSEVSPTDNHHFLHAPIATSNDGVKGWGGKRLGMRAISGSSD